VIQNIQILTKVMQVSNGSIAHTI